MKAIAVFPERKEVKLIEHEEPQISQPQQVKLRMLDIGVCGTDKEICTSGFGSPPAGFPYLILGHEGLGEVVEVGSGVQTLRVGDLAAPVVRHPCTHSTCLACRAGRQDFCQSGDYSERGIKDAHGYMADLVVDDEQAMYLVPQELRDVGVLTEPLTIAEKALAEYLDVQRRLPWFSPGATPGKDQRALVLGSGPIGILGAMLLVIAGFETIVYSRSALPNPKSDIITAISATYLSTESLTVPQLKQRFGTFDLVYEALGGAPIVFETMQALGPNSVFLFTGVPEQIGPTPIDTPHLIHQLVMHNQVILGTVNTDPACFSSAIQHLAIFMQRWPLALHSLIRRYPVEDFHEVLFGKPRGIKNVLAFSHNG